MSTESIHTSAPEPEKYANHTGPITRWLVLAVLCFFTASQAQEAVRMSLASAEAAEARQKAASTIGYHNLKWGPTAWNFAAGLGLEFNDNVYYTSSDERADLIVRPQVDAWMLWPVSEQNSLALRLGAGYSAYLEPRELRAEPVVHYT
jgi:hypothetical protein